MTAECDYFRLYDPEAGAFTEWGDTLWTRVEEDMNLTQLAREISRESSSTELLEQFRERHAVPADQPIPDQKAFVLEYCQSRYDVPKVCPHPPVDGGERCVFHTPLDARDEHDDRAVRRALIEAINESEADPDAVGDTLANCFVGGRFGTLDLTYNSLEPSNNFPIDFRFCTFDELVLDHAEFESTVRFDYSTVRSGSAIDASFERGASFAHAEFGGDRLSFEKARFAGGLTDFEQVRFDVSDVDFSRASFLSTEVQFMGATFCVGSGADENTVNFHQSVFEGGQLNFENAKLGAVADRSPMETQRTEAHRRTDVYFSECKFSSDTTRFAGATFFGPVSFRGSIFGGRDVNFANASFIGAVREVPWTVEFSSSQFDCIEVNFMNAKFRDLTVLFDGVDFDCEELLFKRVATSSPIRMRETRLRKGEIEELEALDADGSSTVYDFTNARIGDVKLETHERETNLFESFKFLRTEFDGFDFSRHNVSLSNNNWVIHSSGFDLRDAPKSALQRLGKYARLVRSGPTSASGLAPADLEATYMKAKNGANRVGHDQAAGKFFQKEMKYRRRKYGDEIWDRTNHATVRLLAAWNWIKNYSLFMMSRYGESPWRVAGFSSAVMVVFAIVFTVVDQFLGTRLPDPYNGLFGPAMLSFESFTTLVLGGGNVESVPIQLLAYTEGFIGAFLIALFVFTLTRSIRR